MLNEHLTDEPMCEMMLHQLGMKGPTQMHEDEIRHNVAEAWPFKSRKVVLDYAELSPMTVGAIIEDIADNNPDDSRLKGLKELWDHLTA